jgi:hypothetical protein
MIFDKKSGCLCVEAVAFLLHVEKNKNLVSIRRLPNILVPMRL